MNLKHVGRLAVIILIFSAVAFVYGTECSADDTRNRNQKDKGSEQKQTIHAVIQFDQLSHDFGTVVQGSEVKHSFIFKNKGNGILKIEKVKAG